MSNDKMREEYEETVRKEFASIGKPEPDLRINYTGDYIHATHAAAWWAWQASRASVVIELPFSDGFDNFSNGFNYARRKAVIAIEAAGLKVKS